MRVLRAAQSPRWPAGGEVIVMEVDLLRSRLNELVVPRSRRACFRLLGEPKTVSLANSLPARPTLNLRPSPCVRHIAYPISPGRPNAHPGRTPSPKPDPLAPPYPKKTSLSRATRSPTLTHPTPHTTHLVPTPASFLPTNPPRSRNFATPLEIYAQACYPRPREEPTPQPGNHTPKRGKPQGIRRGVVPCGRPVAVKTRLSDPAPSPCPPLPRGATLVPRNPAPALQIRAGSPAPPAMNTTKCRRNEQTSPSREACPRGSMP